MYYFDYSFLIKSLFWGILDQRHKLEMEVKKYLDTKNALGTSFGRTALTLAIMSLTKDHQKPEVIIPSFTCAVVTQAIIMAGAVPRFVDLCPSGFCYDIGKLRHTLNKKTVAVVITHYFGNVSENIKQVIDICQENDIKVIEDCAHSFGASFKGKKVGTFGDIGIFSLTKGMLNYGGGVLVTDDNLIANKSIKILRQNKFRIRRKIADFPLVLCYGLEQATDKLYCDRLEGFGNAKYAAQIAEMVKRARKFIFDLRSYKVREKFETGYDIGIYKEVEPGDYDFDIAKIITATARLQIEKIDINIARRKAIYDKIAANCKYTFKIGAKESQPAYTNVLFRVQNHNICELILTLRKQGIWMRSTWPLRQRLLAEQRTNSVKTISTETMVWNINPDLSECEIYTLCERIEKACMEAI